MNFIISLNKPKGITSHDAVTKVKRILKVKKAGHTGTLDPNATGLLLICTDRATRLATYFSALDKEYTSVLKLGEATDTQDAQGTIISTKDIGSIERTRIIDVLKSFEGKILQLPPMFSALKHNGKPLYKLARKGIEVERQPREVHIRRIEPVEIRLPYVTFITVCSKGTYIRTLCNDIGEKLGVGGHLYELERTAVGTFNITDSIDIDTLRNVDTGLPVHKGVYSMDEALSWMPAVKIKDPLIWNVKNGIPLKIIECAGFSNDHKNAESIRIKSANDNLLAVGSYSAPKHIIKMDVVFA